MIQDDAGKFTHRTLEKDLRRAIREKQFFLDYQPQINRDGQCTGAEALLRWNHPTLGLMVPSQFIPLAEASGLIIPVGEWVLQDACNQIKQFQRDPLTRHLEIAVNVSLIHLMEKRFVERVKFAIADIDPRLLTLEITESVMMGDTQMVIQRIRAIKEMGCSFAIDDFGTGFSSLSYLKTLPVDHVKIDKSFVDDIFDHPRHASMVEAIINISKIFNLGVTAEGVETKQQHELLWRIGCEIFQGFHIGMPGHPNAIYSIFAESTSEAKIAYDLVGIRD
ncbi:MAG: EAL domain-containing protein [Burkholderiales bacterium]|nr:EAL domain-containing protein [Burkholderiales bacterium]